ncbi:hypothetical protein SCHIN_v1c11470 [Spiroplasma chinense]|uniref:Uncharacterized protein n=1 Tax=Spiroplasma chinense TaxID=216932 RepID=A0A5B9Y5V4_9MOLU|nr:hypothetical protein [Spiroplasma chinense]QEH62340.1 hypothetical protein SCHIN_v1c11470 [Spiroplasma chinense]
MSRVYIRDYGANDKLEFLNKYRYAYFRYSYGYNFANNGNNSWTHSKDGVNMGTPGYDADMITLTSGDSNNTVIDGYFQHTSASRHVARIQFNINWITRDVFDFGLKVVASLNYGNNSSYVHAAYVGIKLHYAYFF